MFMVNVGKYNIHGSYGNNWVFFSFSKSPMGFVVFFSGFFSLLNGQLGIPGGGLRFLRICCRLEDGSYVSYGDSSFEGSGVLLGESKETPSLAFWAAASEEAPGRELVRVVR